MPPKITAAKINLLRPAVVISLKLRLLFCLIL